ncbi:hypothetical protein [Lacrimispora amygdalina]|uniref:hypothetical protein n=1 Tax=Lacrimispora amygdalina TaxID=253257 RepID=UPI000BE2534D|nr:hypothetical protein [Lacrimispora amygdalina]
MRFCNNFKVKGIDPADKRKAPAISVNEFKKYLTDYYNMNAGIGESEDYITDALEKEEFIKQIFKRRATEDCKGFYSEMNFISDDPISEVIKPADGTPSLLGINVLSNKVPIYGFFLGGELEKPFFAIMYWNGRDLRVLIPESGNTINSDFYTAFGSEAYTAAENPGKMVDECERLIGKRLEDIKCSKISEEELEFIQPGVAYCLKNGYASTEDEAVEVTNTLSWSFIKEDIESMIEESDEMDEPEEISSVADLDDEADSDFDEEEDYDSDYEADDEECDDDDETDETCPGSSKTKEDDKDDGYEVLESITLTLPPSEEDDVLEFKILNEPEITTDSDFCNKKRSMIRFGKLTLPKMEPEKFRIKLNEFYDTTERAIFDYTMNPIKLAQNIMSTSDVIIDVDFATIKECESKITSISDVSLLGFNVLANGIPFFGIEVGENDQSLFVALFWNGACIVPYIPSYGNTFNADLRTVFGKESESIDKFKYIREYEKICKEKISTENDSTLSEFYFKSKGYSTEHLETLKHKGSWNAMLEDLNFAVHIEGKSE